jgi:hypothetical protein
MFAALTDGGPNMTLKNFRVTASVMIIFNVIGTILTWTAHLVKPGTANSHAIYAGTEFTGPVLFIALWIVFVLMTLSKDSVSKIGAVLMTIFALVYGTGETAELFKSNVGLSSAKWNLIIAASCVGLAIAAITAILGIGHLVRSRKV